MSKFHKIFLYQALTGGVQALLFTSLVFVDIYLTGQLGDAEVAAVGIASRMIWLVSMLLFGMGSGAGVFFAQCFGRDDADGFRNVFKTSLLVNLVIAIPSALVFFLFPQQLLSYVTNDAEVVNLAVGYLRIASGTLIFGALLLAIDYLYRATNKPKMPLIAGIVEIAVNIVLSFVLVFGWYGFPEMGVVGAAWGSLVGRLLRVATLFYFLAKHEDYVRVFEINWLTLPKKQLLNRYLQKAIPLMFNAAVWAIGLFLYSYVFAQISVEALAGWNALLPLQGLCHALLGGMSTAAGMTVGQSLGANRIDEAWYRAKFSSVSALILGAMITTLLIIFSDYYVNCFGGITAETKSIISSSVFIIAIMLPFDALNIILFPGVFRAGGANMVNLISDVTASFVIALPLACYAAFYLHWEVVWVIAIIFASEGFKSIFCVYYFFSKRWLKQLEV